MRKMSDGPEDIFREVVSMIDIHSAFMIMSSLTTPICMVVIAYSLLKISKRRD